MHRGNMPYARARLLLGILGVGTLVVVSLLLLIFDIPNRVLPETEQWRFHDILSLFAFVLTYALFMLPLDLLGGFYLPRRYKRSSLSLGSYVTWWIHGVVLQTTVFLVVALSLLAAGRLFGLSGAASTLVLLSLACLVLQERHSRSNRVQLSDGDASKVRSATSQLEQLGFRTVPVVVRFSRDVGFTGGIVGIPGRESSIIPQTWIRELSSCELAVALARRSVAVSSGGRSRGLLLAIGWVVTSFLVAAMLSGSETTSVAGLVTIIMGFTVCTFVGLLVLPAISRQASYAIDQQILDQGVERQVLISTVEKLDHLQDDEPERSPLIESIFHPVPSVENRKAPSPSRTAVPYAWHAARMTIFLSWSCVGLLSRAVHCNVGRPDLWLMLPTD